MIGDDTALECSRCGRWCTNAAGYWDDNVFVPLCHPDDEPGCYQTFWLERDGLAAARQQWFHWLAQESFD